MTENTITVSCASQQRMGSRFDIRECVFSVSEVLGFDTNVGYHVRCYLPLCEEGMTDDRAVCGGECKCRDMKDEMRPFMSGKEVGEWYLEDELKNKYKDLIHNSALPPVFDPGQVVVKYDYDKVDWFRVTINVPHILQQPRTTAWSGTYEWHGRLNGRWRTLQDVVDLIIESSRVHDDELREKEKFYESFVRDTIEKHGRRVERMRRGWFLWLGLALLCFALLIVTAIVFL